MKFFSVKFNYAILKKMVVFEFRRQDDIVKILGKVFLILYVEFHVVLIMQGLENGLCCLPSDDITLGSKCD